MAGLFTVEWSQGPWDAVLANNFIDGSRTRARAASPSPTRRPALGVSTYSTFDARVSYKFGAMVLPRLQEARLAVGVNNIGDRRPPAAPKAFPDNGADVSTYNPIGRLWYVQLMTRF